MGQIVLPASGPVYVDTSVVIYFVEKIEPYRTASLPLWDALDAGDLQVLTSDLTLLEVLVKPLRDGNKSLTDLFRKLLLGTSGLTCVTISRPLLQTAAGLRATHNLRTPDAIHAASSLEGSCTMFVTNDTGFRRVPGLKVEILAEIAAS
jgi:predicted nucleic acid-binding protein